MGTILKFVVILIIRNVNLNTPLLYESEQVMLQPSDPPQLVSSTTRSEGAEAQTYGIGQQAQYPYYYQQQQYGHHVVRPGQQGELGTVHNEYQLESRVIYVRSCGCATAEDRWRQFGIE